MPRHRPWAWQPGPAQAVAPLAALGPTGPDQSLMIADQAGGLPERSRRTRAIAAPGPTARPQPGAKTPCFQAARAIGPCVARPDRPSVNGRAPLARRGGASCHPLSKPIWDDPEGAALWPATSPAERHGVASAVAPWSRLSRALPRPALFRSADCGSLRFPRPKDVTLL